MGKQKRDKKNVHFRDPDRKGMSGIVCGVASDSNLKKKKVLALVSVVGSGEKKRERTLSPHPDPGHCECNSHTDNTVSASQLYGRLVETCRSLVGLHAV